MSKNREAAERLFKNHPAVNTLYFTSDSQAFNRKFYAEAHAATLQDKGIEPINREAESTVGTSSNTPKPQKAEEVIAAINAATTLEEVNALLEGEERKTVKAAGAAKVEELQKLAEGHGAKQPGNE